jgi:hypothetical protein
LAPHNRDEELSKALEGTQHPSLDLVEAGKEATQQKVALRRSWDGFQVIEVVSICLSLFILLFLRCLIGDRV